MLQKFDVRRCVGEGGDLYYDRERSGFILGIVGFRAPLKAQRVIEWEEENASIRGCTGE